jgi:inorganic pyrophosphatase
VPLLAPGSTAAQLLFSYINEIPKGARPKMEIATKEAGNPIKQDVKKGALRRFTYGDLPFNYGCLPQTWENPLEAHHLTKRKGDNDPVDVVELSDAPLAMGSVNAVKVLGVLALLDEEETDWKVLAINADHPLASQLKNAEDVELHFPGKIDAVREWFRNYKTTDGKAVNEFAFDGKVSAVLSHAIERGKCSPRDALSVRWRLRCPMPAGRATLAASPMSLGESQPLQLPIAELVNSLQLCSLATFALLHVSLCSGDGRWPDARRHLGVPRRLGRAVPRRAQRKWTRRSRCAG